LNKHHFFLIAAVSIFQYSCGQNPKLDSSRKADVLDSLRYIPQPVGWVNDFMHLFSEQESKSLDSLISKYEKQTTVEFSVATIDSSMMGPIDFEPYTLLMMRTWGVGKKEKNNGVLIVIAPTLRRIRIRNGYGIEKILTNEQTKAIINETIIPYFKKAEFYQGTREGILAIISKLEKNGL
jgi:uncharacterized protein